METKEKIYTDQDWENDGTLKVQVGQIIAPEVFWQLLNCVPPKTYSKGIFQVGEPYSHDWDTGKALYQTFELAYSKGREPYYRYVGLKH
jgi:hypothetical protein